MNKRVSVAENALRFALLPFAAFAIAYFVLTYPLALKWPTEYFVDAGDGAQMVWNVWWVDHALTHFHNPWFTNFLHWPSGSTLLLHSLTPINGLMYGAFVHVLPPVAAFNLLILLAFALSGLTAFWLAYHVTGRYWPSLAAGYIFTFSGFHFAHAPGHLTTITMQFLPLFVLLWLRLLQRPKAATGIGAAMALLLVLLSDHYMFLYAAMIGTILLIWAIAQRRRLDRSMLRGLVVFSMACVLTCGPLLFTMLWTASRGAAAGEHDASQFSADLLSPLVPGWAWHWHDLTRWSWTSSIWSNYAETSVNLGASALVAAIIGWWGDRNRLSVWLFIATLFVALAMGPTLTFLNRPITSCTPYRLFESVFPPLRMSGCPARFMVGAQLAIAVLAAAGLARLSTSQCTARRRLLGSLFVLAMVIESEPRYQTTFSPTPPPWVIAVRDAPVPGALIDVSTGDEGLGMYYQTIHHRPITGGVVARWTQNVEESDQHVRQLFWRRDYDALVKLGITLVAQGDGDPKLERALIFDDGRARVYRLDQALQRD